MRDDDCDWDYEYEDCRTANAATFNSRFFLIAIAIALIIAYCPTRHRTRPFLLFIVRARVDPWNSEFLIQGLGSASIAGAAARNGLK